MIFDFAGDDDVWVFIDDVLILDIGGMHAAIKGYIDFATGEVNVNGQNTTLKQLFIDAGVTNGEWKGNTFADNTNHTLKMFYMERGNYASSLNIRFNLKTQSNNKIKKVDKNGQLLSNVTFDLYQSDINGNKKGNILTTLETDEQGIAEFKDTDDKSYDFENQYLQKNIMYYLLEEHTPQGYKSSNKKILLKYDPNTQTIESTNKYENGVLTNFDIKISGKGNINYAKYNEKTGAVEKENNIVNAEYRNDSLILAVPMIKQNNQWNPLYQNKYSLSSIKSSNYSFQEQVLISALYQVYYNKDSSWKLVWDTNKEEFNYNIKDLPYEASRYISKNSNGDMDIQYIIISKNILNHIGITNSTQALSSYIKSKIKDENNLEESIASLAYNIISISGSESNQEFSFINLDNFTKTYSSTITIPNELKQFRVKKVNNKGEPLNNAKFSIFSTLEDAENEVNPISTGYTGTIDGEEGILIFSQNGQSMNGYANMNWESKSNEKKYYLKEMSTVEDYVVNETIIPIIADNYGIYADAGTEEDGISVTSEVGKLTKIMREYANEQNINLSLKDITITNQVQNSASYNSNGWNDSEEIINLSYKSTNNGDYKKTSSNDYSPKTTGFVRIKIEQNKSNLQNKDNINNDITELYEVINTVIVQNEKQERIITGIAFEDLNDNNEYDESEDILLSNIKVSLIYKDKEVASINTDENGYYEFKKLQHSEYYILFSVPQNKYVIEMGDKENNSKTDDNGKTDSLIFVSFDEDILRIDNINLGVKSKKIKFTKVDENNHNNFISNDGVFELYEYTCDLNDSSYNDLVKSNSECFKLIDQLSPNDEGEVIFTGLNSKAYRLVEAEAPDGYIKPEGEWNITFEEENISSIVCIGGGCPAFKKENDELYLPNRSIISIPSSGGKGRMILTILGIVLMGLNIIFKKNRKNLCK